MNKSILTERQVLFLDLFSYESTLSGKFYLTGGTALAAFYIPYRLSEDLDFFSEQEVVIDEIVVFLRSVKNKLGYDNFNLNSSFNRNLIFLNFPNYQLKLEFTYFPFPQIDKPQVKAGLKIDSILDIAVNKLFTIYQNPRSRDFIDLYMICQKFNFKIDELIKQAKIKFDWHVDPLKLGSQFLLAKELKDYPNLIEPIEESAWQDFFQDQAKKLGKQVIED